MPTAVYTSVTWLVFTFLPTSTCAISVCASKKSSSSAVPMEHGVPVTIRARKEGCTVQEVVDRYHHLIKQSFEDFGISFDIYSRTTSDTHKKVASDFFRKLYDKGEFLERESEQYYDEEAKTFLADRYITGECPHCHNPHAYGDQCEKCGKTFSHRIDQSRIQSFGF